MGIDPSQIAQVATRGFFEMISGPVRSMALSRFGPKPVAEAEEDDEAGLARLREYGDLPEEIDDEHPLGSTLLGDREADRAEFHATALGEDLFASVVGLDDEKAVLRACYTSPRALHAILVSAPGGAKSVMLDAMSRAPDTMYIVGGNTTPAGLIAILENESTRPHVLLIDEIEKSSKEFQDSLLSAMSGKLVVAKHLQSSNVDIDTRFIGAANSLTDPRHPVSAPLRSRMTELHLQPYDEATRHKVIQSFLVNRLDASPAEADAVANLIAPISADVRDAEQSFLLYRQNPELAQRMAVRLRAEKQAEGEAIRPMRATARVPAMPREVPVSRMATRNTGQKTSKIEVARR